MSVGVLKGVVLFLDFATTRQWLEQRVPSLRAPSHNKTIVFLCGRRYAPIGGLLEK